MTKQPDSKEAFQMRRACLFENHVKNKGGLFEILRNCQLIRDLNKAKRREFVCSVLDTADTLGIFFRGEG